MSDAWQPDDPAPGPQATRRSDRTFATLVATKALAELARPPSGPDPEPRWSAARLPIVERDSYEIAGEIAHGGVGRILRGRSVHLDRPVAIKELLEPGDAAAERFVCEALLTARLQHPSIVPVYEAGRWPSGELFYAMKLVSGRSLDDVLSAGATPLRTLAERLRLLPHVVAVAEAMAYAHSERIIHRDLKPANILVGSFGETVVIDWGLAKDLAGPTIPPPAAFAAPSIPPPSTRARVSTPPSVRAAPYRAAQALTIAGAVMGTPAYMPPEQAAGLSVDERADVYALGAILYHVIAGAPPYEGRDVRAVLQAVAAGPPRPLGQRERTVSLELCTIVDKAMARDPADRYPSARELAADLTRFATGQVVGAHKYTASEMVLRAVRPFRAPLAVAAAALVALSAAIGVGFERTVAARDRAELSRLAAEAARREAIHHADDLTLVQARTSAAREPDRALGWLASLSPSFARWSAARVIAADASTHGLGLVLRGHTEGLNAVALSPDGRLAATTSDDHTARLWVLDGPPTQPLQSHVLAGHGDEVWSVAFSPDGKSVATSSKDRTIRLWDVATRASRVLAGHASGVTGVAFLADGQHLVSSSYDHTVRLWDLATGESREIGQHADALQALALSRDGRLVVTGALDGEVRLSYLDGGADRVLGKLPQAVWNLAVSADGTEVAARSFHGATATWRLSGTTRAARTMHTDPPLSATGYPAQGLVFSPDDRLLAFGEGASLVIVDRVRGTRRTLEGHEGKVGLLAFSPDGRHLAAGCGTGAVQIWDVDRGLARTLRGFEDTSIGMVFSADGRTLAVASYDHTARLFPVESEDARVLEPHGGRATVTAFSPDGAALATADADGAVLLWDLTRKGADPVRAVGHAAGVCEGAWSPDGSLLATLGHDGAVRAWDRWGHLRHASSADAGKTAGDCGPLVFSADGRLLAFATPGQGVGVVDLESGSERSLVSPEGNVHALAFAPDGGSLASGSFDDHQGTVRLWDLATGTAPATSRVLFEHETGVSSLAFAPDGSVLASGGQDHTLRLWSAATDTTRVVDAGGGGIAQLAFSPDGRSLFSLGALEAGVRIWDPRTGLPRGGLLRGHDGGVTRFALSPDGGRLATAGVDQTVRLWDLVTRESRALRGHHDTVNDVAFSPDGRTLASAANDGIVRLWRDDLPDDPDALQAWIHQALRGALPVTAPGHGGAGDPKGNDTEASDTATDPAEPQPAEPRPTEPHLAPPGTRGTKGS